MAEQEVIKHTKNIFNIWGIKKAFWHKLREFLLEIIIIVFAISLSIYVHDRSVKKHQQQEVKEFLLGLKQDLTTDITEMGEDRKAFDLSGHAFSYISHLKMHETPDKDTLKKYYTRIFNTTGLIPNSGRFEGFKSAGKIGTIENMELQNDIMDLYQENIPSLIISTNAYSLKKQKLLDFVNENRKRITDSTTNIISLVSSDVVFNMSSNLVFVNEIFERYDLCINKMNKIISEINKEYGEEE